MRKLISLATAAHSAIAAAVAALIMSTLVLADVVPLRDLAQDLPCSIEQIFAKYEASAKAQADALRDKKNQELIDPENRADRARNRLDKGEAVSWEGGSARHRLAFDVPKMRTHRVSFDIVETYMADTRTQVPDGVKTCMVNAGFVKTKVPCGVHYRDVVVTVPQFRKKTVSLDLPDAIKWQRVDIVYDTPTVTMRDEKHDLDAADGNIDRIRKELLDGTKAIADRTSAAFFAEATSIINRTDQAALADFDAKMQERLVLFAKLRSESEAKRAAARAAAGDKAGEVDAAFAKVTQAIDQAEARAREEIVSERKAISQPYTDLRDLLAKSSIACVKHS